MYKLAIWARLATLALLWLRDSFYREGTCPFIAVTRQNKRKVSAGNENRRAHNGKITP